MGNIQVIPTFQPGLTDHSLALFLADLRSWVFRSQARAAQHFLLDRTTIWRYEEGKTQPLPGYLAALARLVGERFESEAATAVPYRQRLLHEINQAILACYPGEQPFAEWEELVRSAEAFQQARQRSPAGRQGSRGKAPPTVAAQQPDAHIDWGDAPEIAAFYGRRHELAMLQHLLIAEQRRVLGVLGVGGVGKTILVARLVDLVKAEFDVIIWRSLVNAPPLGLLLSELLRLLADSAAEPPPAEDQARLLDLLAWLQRRRCLLVLDNFETVLDDGERTGAYRQGYEGYGQLLRLFGELRHRSCLVLTSREEPRELQTLAVAVQTAPRSYSYTLSGLTHDDARELIVAAGLSAQAHDLTELVERCSGNPKILEIVAATIREFYSGSVAAFLQSETIVFGEVRDIMQQQFARLNHAQKELLYWLAISREQLSLAELRARLLGQDSRDLFLETVKTLRARSLIDGGQTILLLQNAIAEYVIEEFLRLSYDELKSGRYHLLHRHALIWAGAPAHVRAGQVRVLLEPLAARLLHDYGRQGVVEHLAHLIDQLRQEQSGRPGYSGGNLLNLLIQLGIALSDWDFSHLALWQTYLQGVTLRGTSFAHADLSGSVFTETFGSVRSVAFSPDMRLLAAGSSNGEIHVWRVSDRTHLRTLDGQAWVEAVAFSPDSRLIAGGGAEPVIRLWDSQSGEMIGQLAGHSAPVRALAFSPDGATLASGSDDATIRLWELPTGRCRTILRSHRGTVWSLAYHPDGRLLASSGNDLLLWQVERGELLKRLEGHTASVMTIAFSPDGTLLASGSYDTSVRLWSVPDGQCQATLQGHSDAVRAVAFSPDGTLLATGGEDQSIRLWQPSNGQQRTLLYDRANRVRSLAFSADGLLLASGSHDQNVRLWSTTRGQCHSLFQGHINQLRTLAISPDGKLLAIGVAENIYLMEERTGIIVWVLRGHNEWVQSLAFSPDGTMLASGSDDHTVRIWRIEDAVPIAVLRGHHAWVQAVAYSPDGRRLVSSSADWTLRIWDVAGGVCLQTLAAHTHHVWTLAISPDGRWLASGGADELIRIWELSSGHVTRILPGHNGAVWSLAFSANSSLLVSGGQDRLIKLWEPAQGRLVRMLPGHAKRIVSITISPDGSLVASGGDDRAVRVWELRSGICRHILSGHSRAVVAVAFSPDGTQVISGSEDGSVRVWDVQSGAHVRTLAVPRPYDELNITGATGLTEAQRQSLLALGAVET